MMRHNCVTRAAFLLATAAALAATLGCGLSTGAGTSIAPAPAPPTAPAKTTYVYVGQGSTATIDQFQIASDGTLAPLTPPTVSAFSPYGPGWIITDPSSTYLFASSFGAPTAIDQFVINSDGTIAPNSVAAVNGGNGVYPFVFTADGKFAIVPSLYYPSGVTTYSLDSSGTLTSVDTLTIGDAPIAAATDPTGKYVYVGGVGNGLDGAIYEYSISADGTLTPLVPASSRSHRLRNAMSRRVQYGTLSTVR